MKQVTVKQVTVNVCNCMAAVPSSLLIPICEAGDCEAGDCERGREQWPQWPREGSGLAGRDSVV